MANPVKFTWTDPTLNTDGSAITAGEITGYSIGVRPSSGTAGTYPIVMPIPGATTTSEPLANLSSILAPGNYAAAIMSVGPVNSAWSAEIAFSIAAPVPTPPTGFTTACSVVPILARQGSETHLSAYARVIPLRLPPKA